MELSLELLKSIDSGVVIVNAAKNYFALKYKGEMFSETGNVRLFANEGAAKSALTKFVRQCFWHAPYWQSCASQIKKRSGYDVDFSGTIGVIGNTNAAWDSSETKKKFKDISNELLAQGIFTIEKV